MSDDNKAFTKEDDGGLEHDPADTSDDQDAELAAIPAGSRNYITPPGADKLKTELRELLHHERPKLVETVTWAASNGDRSENGDYIYGKKRLREIDRRIRFLTKRLEAAEIVNPTEQGPRAAGKVLFGAHVRVSEDLGNKTIEKTYRIVGIDETDVRAGAISWISPMARALLGSAEGDAVTLRVPGGHEKEIEILEVSYPAPRVTGDSA